MNGKYIVVNADGSIEIGAGEDKVPLAFMQEKVGGLIERIPLPFETTIDLWCDDEGLFKDYNENVMVSNYLNRVWNCGDWMGQGGACCPHHHASRRRCGDAQV